MAIRLGEREYVLLEGLSVGRRNYLMGMIYRHRIDEVAGQGPEESVGAYGGRLMHAVLATADGSYPSPAEMMLAAALTEPGAEEKDWTPKVAAATAGFLAGLTSPADQASIEELWALWLAAFFGTGLASLENSTSSSQPVEAEGPGGEPTSSH
jgi:hypothetical protein